MSIDPRRIDKAVAEAHRLAAEHNSMGLAVTIAAEQFAMPRARLVQALHRRKAQYKEERQREAAGMWWNK